MKHSLKLVTIKKFCWKNFSLFFPYKYIHIISLTLTLIDVEITPKLGRECEQIQNEWFFTERTTDRPKSINDQKKSSMTCERYKLQANRCFLVKTPLVRINCYLIGRTIVQFTLCARYTTHYTCLSTAKERPLDSKDYFVLKNIPEFGPLHLMSVIAETGR